MSAKLERAITTPTSTKARAAEVVVNFDAEKVKAPFLLRCGAILIDYIILVSVPVLSLIIARLLGNDGTKLLKSELSSAGWLIGILLALTNFVVFPMFAGQSIGKMFTGIRILRIDGGAAGFGQLLIRHLLGYPLTALTLGLGFLISFFNSNGRALHDLIAGTVVIYGRRKPKVIANAAAGDEAAEAENSGRLTGARGYDTKRLDNQELLDKI